VAPHDSPLLDLGGDVGALVVHLPGPPPSGEIEARPAGAPGARFHTGVHRRATPAGETWAAVFPDVWAGDYDLLGPDGGPIARVVVTGGRVAELDLR
jgi:hypothetical protein